MCVCFVCLLISLQSPPGPEFSVELSHYVLYFVCTFSGRAIVKQFLIWTLSKNVPDFLLFAVGAIWILCQRWEQGSDFLFSAIVFCCKFFCHVLSSLSLFFSPSCYCLSFGSYLCCNCRSPGMSSFSSVSLFLCKNFKQKQNKIDGRCKFLFNFMQNKTKIESSWRVWSIFCAWISDEKNVLKQNSGQIQRIFGSKSVFLIFWHILSIQPWKMRNKCLSKKRDMPKRWAEAHNKRSMNFNNQMKNWDTLSLRKWASGKQSCRAESYWIYCYWLCDSA